MAISDGSDAWPCVPYDVRVGHLHNGTPLIKVAEGNYARKRYTTKYVMLSGDSKQVWWDEGKKSVDLATVQRVTVGLETRTLQRLYSGSTSPQDVSAFHWFSLHTSSRSFDFGATNQAGGDLFGDENKTVVLWVLTMQDLLASALPPEQRSGACCALSNAQYRWQQFDSPQKEWPCLVCTFLNPPDSPRCRACESPRPAVTLCPCLAPLSAPLKALGNTLGLRAFEDCAEAHLLWFLVQALEAPHPQPFRWAMRARPAAPTDAYLIMTSDQGTSYDTANHPHLLELRRNAETLREQLLANGGVLDFASPLLPQPVTPRASTADMYSPEPSSSRDGGSDADLSSERSAYGAGLTPRSTAALEGLSPRAFEEALAAAAVHESPATPRGAAPPDVARSSSLEDQTLDAADVFRHCMSGNVAQVRRFLELGGHADTVYKSAYGWDVGPDVAFTKPADGTTVLNYVATWSDIIGESDADAPVAIAKLLLHHHADVQRDDAQDLWFTPVHNATANGAYLLVRAMLEHMPQCVNLTTGDGRTPLHVLTLCDDSEDRLRTLEVLLQRRRDVELLLNFQEPFCGNTALHAAAKEGHHETVGRMLEAGASLSVTNEAGRTPLEEAKLELATLNADPNPNVMRLSKLNEAISVMEIFALSDL